MIINRLPIGGGGDNYSFTTLYSNGGGTSSGLKTYTFTQDYSQAMLVFGSGSNSNETRAITYTWTGSKTPREFQKYAHGDNNGTYNHLIVILEDVVAGDVFTITSTVNYWRTLWVGGLVKRGKKASGFEAIPWFVKGELFNTDIFGVPNFYHQQNGTVNSDTYATDGYIHANYTSTGYSSVFVMTDNYVPKIYDFALFRIRHIRIASSNSGLGFGTTDKRNDMSRMSYRWSNTNADNDYWLTVPLDVYNSLGVNEYLSIGGASEFYIYEIYFVKAAS